MIHRISLIQTYGPMCFLLPVLLNIGRQLRVLFQLEIVLLNQRLILLQRKTSSKTSLLNVTNLPAC